MIPADRLFDLQPLGSVGWIAVTSAFWAGTAAYAARRFGGSRASWTLALAAALVWVTTTLGILPDALSPAEMPGALVFFLPHAVYWALFAWLLARSGWLSRRDVARSLLGGALLWGGATFCAVSALLASWTAWSLAVPLGTGTVTLGVLRRIRTFQSNGARAARAWLVAGAWALLLVPTILTAAAAV